MCVGGGGGKGKNEAEVQVDHRFFGPSKSLCSLGAISARLAIAYYSSTAPSHHLLISPPSSCMQG